MTKYENYASVLLFFLLAFAPNNHIVPDEALLPRKQPQQARAAATVEVILQAATRVLNNRSLEGFNTNLVAEVAVVSVGSLYQYFPNKAALVAKLIERAQNRLATDVEQSLQSSRGQQLADVLSQLIEVAIQHQFENANLARALDLEEERLPLYEVLNASQLRITTAFQQALSGHSELASMEVSPASANDCLTIAKALIETEANRIAPDLLELHKRILRALLGYLLQTPEPHLNR